MTNPHPHGGPRVSVVMPFLDTPRVFFEQAVESVIAQTYTDWELLLVNDGSGPEALDVALQLVRRSGARIQCISHPDNANRGISASRNLGLSRSRGSLIALLDSDDQWLPHKLQDQVAILDEFPRAQMVFGRSLFWHSWRGDRARGRTDHVPILGVADRTLLEPPEFLHGFIRGQIMVPCPSSVLVRASAARAVSGFEDDFRTDFYEEQVFYAKIGLAYPVIACADIWDRYRLHERSLLAAGSEQQAISARRHYLEWLRGYLDAHNHGDDAFRRALAFERWLVDVWKGPRIMRSLRRLARIPGRLRSSFRSDPAG
jgi:glycosyltransferase involved in cell wall biosynthesis